MAARPQAADPPPRRRLEHGERRRQILASAQQQFRERHYEAVSMDAVAQAAGVTRGLLHHYFGSKHDLYLEVVRAMFREAGAPPVPEYVQGVTPEERLADSVDRWLDMVRDNRETWLAAIGAKGLGRDPELEQLLDRIREAAADSIIEVLGIGPAAQASRELRAVLRSFGGLAEAAAVEWLARDRFTREQLHVFLTATLLTLVGEVLPRVEAAG